MFASILFFAAACLIIVPLLNLLLPNFKRQQQVASIASFLGKGENEIRQMKQNSMIRMFSEHVLPKVDRKWSLDNIFGKSLRERYAALGRNETYLEYLGKYIVIAILVGLSFFATGMMIENKLLSFFAPAAAILIFSVGARDIHAQYKKRQNTLIRDLPNLIGKITITLESGKSLPKVLSEVAEEQDATNPLLSAMLKRLIANSQQMPLREAFQIFADEVKVPEVYDFVSVLNVALEKGYKEAIPDLDSMKNDIRNLRRISLIELTKGNPSKMNIYYVIIILHIIVFVFMCASKMFSAITNL